MTAETTYCPSLWGGNHGCGLERGHEGTHQCGNCDESWTDDEARAWAEEVRRRIAAQEYDQIGDGVYRICPLRDRG
jgi:hypothetical protein